MRLLWLLLFTLTLAAVVTVDAGSKKSGKKEESADEGKGGDADASNDDDDEEDAEEDDGKQKSDKKTAKKKDDSKNKKKAKDADDEKEDSKEDDDEEEEEDSDDESYEPPPAKKEEDNKASACDKFGPCVCYKKKLDCDDADVDSSSDEDSDSDDDMELFDQPSKLDSANLVLPDKFKPNFVSFRRNAIKQLRKGKVVPLARESASHLRFNNNNITVIEPGTLQEFKNLTHLDLSNNQLNELHKTVFEGLEKLQFLDLSKNGITKIPKKIFKDMKALKILILDENKLTELHKDVFYGLSSLKKLSLDNCGLDDKALNITVFDNIEDTLEEISLTDNPLTQVPRAIDGLEKLKAFDMSGTELVEIDEDSFSDDHNVETVLMREMKFLWRVGECAFCGLKKLKASKVMNPANYLQAIDFTNSSQLYMIHENAFGFVKSEAGAPENLTQVSFENCNFTTFPADLLNWKSMSQTNGLRIGGNHFVCDCSLLHLLGDEVLAKSVDGVTVIPICEKPSHLAGKPLAAVNLQEEHCVSESRVQRFAYWLALLIMLVALSFAVYLVLTSRQLSALIHRHPIQDIRYSHVGREDVQNLETDFQPRSADP